MFIFSCPLPCQIQLLVWELAGAAVKAISDLLHMSGGPGPSASLPFSLRLTEKGILQLMLDVRTIRDVLAGGRPPQAATRPSAGGPVAVSPAAQLLSSSPEVLLVCVI